MKATLFSLRLVLLLATLLVLILATVLGNAQVLAAGAQQAGDTTDNVPPDDPPTHTPTATATATGVATTTATPTATSTATATPTTAATASATSTATPTASPTPTGTVTVTPTPVAWLHLPVLFRPVAGGPLPPPQRREGLPPIDFAAVRDEARRQGLELAFNKIGFHVGVGGNRDGLTEDYIQALDAAGIPAVVKSANDAEPLYIAQELMKTSGVPHVLIYRDSTRELDNPRFDLEPELAAELSWEANRNVFPPELDKDVVWIETVNEPDKNRADWLARFSLETARRAVDEGYKYAAFSWSSGEPEPEQWETPEMLAFLRFAGEHPDQVAIALHEYSFLTEEIGHIYPFLVGRFQALYAICDKYNIPRPTVIITEWGWEYNRVPTVAEAMDDIRWASWLYAAYPQVLGAAIWYLGPNFSDIDDQTQLLIAPVGEYSLGNYFLYTPGIGPIDSSLFIPIPPTYLDIE